VAGAAAPQGAILYLDHPSPGLFRTTAITRLVCANGQATIDGQGIVEGATVTFRSNVTDAGAHGDLFAIQWPEYGTAGPVVVGAIRIH
jgi:hypothetical protein